MKIAGNMLRILDGFLCARHTLQSPTPIPDMLMYDCKFIHRQTSVLYLLPINASRVWPLAPPRAPPPPPHCPASLVQPRACCYPPPLQPPSTPPLDK